MHSRDSAGLNFAFTLVDVASSIKSPPTELFAAPLELPPIPIPIIVVLVLVVDIVAAGLTVVAAAADWGAVVAAARKGGREGGSGEVEGEDLPDEADWYWGGGGRADGEAEGRGGAARESGAPGAKGEEDSEEGGGGGGRRDESCCCWGGRSKRDETPDPGLSCGGWDFDVEDTRPDFFDLPKNVASSHSTRVLDLP
ncbi:hypothetical protein Pelo_10715 [Pelomyxa schiedti]|nr:hypothetical protein Pelo_10708 [Pelomyxa schiedti]KAH3757490.1 hypothetical protein Pelo_10715 [Pelomyxa schiedti]